MSEIKRTGLRRSDLNTLARVVETAVLHEEATPEQAWKKAKALFANVLPAVLENHKKVVFQTAGVKLEEKKATPEAAPKK